MEWPQWSQEPGRRHLRDLNIVSSITLDLAHWLGTDQIWNLDIQNFIEQVFSRRGEVDLTQAWWCSPSACMEEAAISVYPLVTHMSDVTQHQSSDRRGVWQIIQCWLFCSFEKTQMLRRQMAVSEEQTAVWVALKAQTGANRCWQLSTKDGPRSLRSTFSILLRSGWFQDIVYTYSNDLLNLLTFTQC